MLGRLGLVIHWIGFLAGVAGIIAGLSSFDLTEKRYVELSAEGAALYAERNLEEMTLSDLYAVRDNNEGGRTFPAYDNWLLILLLGVGPISLAWAIRFILTSHKSPLPWVANKETNND
jgi:hypothetical protein